MVALGLLDGRASPALIEAGAYRAFYMHRTSHWLGMDVHDVGFYYGGRRAAPARARDGAHHRARALRRRGRRRVPPEFRGLGVRIEDDILVTESGHDNLTADIPKSVADIEALATSA